jgi:hypothetical protein
VCCHNYLLDAKVTILYQVHIIATESGAYMVQLYLIKGFACLTLYFFQVIKVIEFIDYYETVLQDNPHALDTAWASFLAPHEPYIMPTKNNPISPLIWSAVS